MLPQQFSNETYWEEIHPQPLSYWQESLARITQRHFRESMRWERAELGRNIVFLNEDWMIKLTPPGWVEDVPRETAALRAVAGRLPVETPELVYAGALDQWQYIIERCLPGANLRDVWGGLLIDQRMRLAFDHGEILSALHSIEVTDPEARAALAYDWEDLLSTQWSECVPEMRRAGVPPALVEQVEGYLESRSGVLRQASRTVLLHGDLTHLNFLAQLDGEHWRITGLIDWGDAKLGAPGHEFISPGVHMYLGDRETLAHFCRGCGDAMKDVQYPDELMARAMLYYAEDFAFIMNRLPEMNTCPDWACISQLMW